MITVAKDAMTKTDVCKSRMEELRGFGDNGTFKPIPRSKVPICTIIFCYCFVDQLKNSNEGTREEKSVGNTELLGRGFHHHIYEDPNHSKFPP